MSSASRALVVNQRGDLKAVEDALPDDSVTRQRLLMALSSQTEAKAWPNTALYTTQAYWYTKSPWVYLAANQIARTAALIKLNAFKMEGEQKVAQINHPIEVLLRKPNPWQSRFELIEQTVGFQQITGNAYWFLYSEKGGTPDEIILLRPDRVRIVAGSDTGQLIGGYVYYLQGMEVPIEPQEVIHFKRFHPLSDYYGLSPLESLAADVQGDAAMAEFNRNFYSKDMAIPAGVVNIKNPISQTEFERIKAEWKDSYGGRNRRTAFLQAAEVEYQDIGLSHKDSDFLNGRQFSKEEILMVYGVPPGMLDKSSTEANATIALEFFTDHTVWPIMTEICQKISSDLCPFYDETLVVEPEDIRPKDSEAERTELQAYGPYLTINEIRARYLNLPPVAWGDQPATGGGTLLAPSALQGVNGQQVNPAAMEQTAAKEPTRTDSGTTKPTQTIPVRQHDVGRTREANREVTRYAKFVLKRAGTDKADEIDNFKFLHLTDEDALGLKTLIDLDPLNARWLLDTTPDPLRSSEALLFSIGRGIQQMLSVKFTEGLFDVYKSPYGWAFHGAVRNVIEGVESDTLDLLAMQTGYRANSSGQVALKRAALDWFESQAIDFIEQTEAAVKAVNSDVLTGGPLFGEARARLFAREAAAQLEAQGVYLAVKAYCDETETAQPPTLPYRPVPEYALKVEAGMGEVKLTWHPLTNNPVGHIRGNLIPKTEAVRVESFSTHEIDGYFAAYEKYTHG